MKRLLAASPSGALAALVAVLAGSMLIGPAALADSNDRDRGRNERSWNDRRDHRHNDSRHADRRRDDRHDHRRHNDRHERRSAHDDRRHYDRDRHDRRYAQYDRRAYERHYRYPPRYRVVHYHPPRGYRPHVWYRGARLPAAYYAPRYVVYNYHDYRLRPPPYGYHWVRVDNDVILAAITTGIVLQVVNGIFY